MLKVILINKPLNEVGASDFILLSYQLKQYIKLNNNNNK
jgi:hypothetical protein